jgi:hypothetical protein
MKRNSLKSKFLASCVGTAVGDQFGASDTRYTDETVIKLWQVKKQKREEK